jgi:Protein of unknown function (DUF2934)
MAQDITGRTTRMVAGAEPQNLEEQIRKRAYELYEARGREDGLHLDDWLRAEGEITQQQRKSRSTAA